jgi:hypothetical protein
VNASGTIQGDTVEVKFTLDVHPDADTLEEYAFGRHLEAFCKTLEEHLLVCHRCQSTLAEIDEFILLMKHATALLAADPRGSPVESVWTGSRRARTGLGLTVASAILGALAFWPVRAIPGANPVQLVALRGAGAASIAHARGGPLDLVIDVVDLPGISRFGLELVDAAGRRHWEGSGTPSVGKLTVRVPKTLGRGTYWVRLSADQGELLREFGLRAD